MCRLSAFPPMFPREDALEILKDMEGANTDGVGSAHIKDGQFVINKWPKALKKVLKKHQFLEHMPHNGWTIAHMRLASHGEVKMSNTHPFVIGESEWAICHNGTWSDYKVAKLAMSKWVKFQGDTDTEVAANLINLVGVQTFTKEISWGGVYLCLNKDGSLWTIKTSSTSDLELINLENGTSVISSDFPINTKGVGTAYAGWYHFNPDGSFDKLEKKESVCNYGYQGTSAYHNSGRSFWGFRNETTEDEEIGFRGLSNVKPHKAKELEAKKEENTGEVGSSKLTMDEKTERIARERETRILNEFGLGVA